MNDPRINELKVATEKMAAGHFRVQVPAARQHDEVDELGRSLYHLGETLDRRFEEMRRISSITEKINAGLLLDQVLDFVFNDFAAVIPYDRIGFALLESDNEVLRARWAKSNAERLEITGGYYQPMAGSSLQAVLASGTPRILNDLEDYLAHKPDSDSTRRIVAEGMRSSLTCPLIALNKPVGFIFFSSMRKNTYQHAHVEIFQQIAGQLSVILEKSRLYQELLELNDLKTKFLGMAAHDLRNPLTVISSYLSILEEDSAAGLTSDLPLIIADMKSSCDAMLNMVETYLDVSAIQSGQLKLKLAPVNMPRFIAEVETPGRILAAAKNIELHVASAPDPGVWVFDRHRMHQVVQNLLSNAIKYSPAGRRIDLTFSRTTDQWCLQVRDQGVGIPADDLPKLFRDFTRAGSKPTAGEKSYGLGLAICRRIVELHHGHLTVESRVGEGSTFTVTLPRLEPAASC